MLTPNSSHIKEVTYNRRTKDLFVVYNNYRRYLYKDVSYKDGKEVMKRAKLSNARRGKDVPKNYKKGSKPEESVGSIVAEIREKYDYKETTATPLWVK